MVQKSREVDALVSAIAQASQEQCSGIDELKQAVGQISEVTQSAAGHADESASGARDLNLQTATLREKVDLRTKEQAFGTPAKTDPIRVASSPASANRIPARAARATITRRGAVAGSHK